MELLVIKTLKELGPCHIIKFRVTIKSQGHSNMRLLTRQLHKRAPLRVLDRHIRHRQPRRKRHHHHYLLSNRLLLPLHRFLLTQLPPFPQRGHQVFLGPQEKVKMPRMPRIFWRHIRSMRRGMHSGSGIMHSGKHSISTIQIRSSFKNGKCKCNDGKNKIRMLFNSKL